MAEGSSSPSGSQEASLAERAAWIGLVLGAFALLVVSLAGYVQLVDQTSDLGFVTHATWWLSLLVSLAFVTWGAVATRERKTKRGTLVFFGLALHVLADISLASWLRFVL